MRGMIKPFLVIHQPPYLWCLSLGQECVRRVCLYQSGENMPEFNLSRLAPEEQEKVSVDLAAAGVAYKERLNMPVVPELVAREQPAHLREYFMERLLAHRQTSQTLPRSGDPRYTEMADANNKGKGGN